MLQIEDTKLDQEKTLTSKKKSNYRRHKNVECKSKTQ